MSQCRRYESDEDNWEIGPHKCGCPDCIRAIDAEVAGEIVAEKLLAKDLRKYLSPTEAAYLSSGNFDYDLWEKYYKLKAMEK